MADHNHGVAQQKPAGQDLADPNPYINNVGGGLFLGGLFGILKESWSRVPSEDVLAQKQFAPGHFANLMRSAVRWGGLYGGVALVYTAAGDLGESIFGEKSRMTKPFAGLMIGLFLGARTASPRVFMRTSAMLCPLLFVYDLFPDMGALQKDVRRDATAMRRARLEAYQREHPVQQEAAHH